MGDNCNKNLRRNEDESGLEEVRGTIRENESISDADWVAADSFDV